MPGLWPSSELLAVTTTQYVLKSGWEVIATPLTYRVVAFLKRAEQEDYYDRDTNFTPFSLQGVSGSAPDEKEGGSAVRRAPAAQPVICRSAC